MTAAILCLGAVAVSVTVLRWSGRLLAEAGRSTGSFDRIVRLSDGLRSRSEGVAAAVDGHADR